MRTLTSAVLGLAIAIGALAQSGVPRPDPGLPDGTRPATPTVTTTSEEGCADLVAYQGELNDILNEGGDAVTYLFLGEAEAAELKASDLEDAFATLDDLFVQLDDLDAPPVFEAGNSGVVGYLENSYEFLKFYAVNSADAPSIDEYYASLQNLYDGEMHVASVCTDDELDELGGYVFIDPSSLTGVVNTTPTEDPDAE